MFDLNIEFLDSLMEFRVGPPFFYAAVVTWRPAIDVHSLRRRIVQDYQKLLVILESDSLSTGESNDVSWIRERMVVLDDLRNVEPNSTDAQPLIEEFLIAAGLQEELDRIDIEDANEVIRNIAVNASLAIASKNE